MKLVFVVKTLFSCSFDAAAAVVKKARKGTSIVKAVRSEIDRRIGENDRRFAAVREAIAYLEGGADWDFSVGDYWEQGYSGRTEVKSCMTGRDPGMFYRELGCDLLVVTDQDGNVMARTIVRWGACLPAVYAASGVWAARLEAAVGLTHLRQDKSLFDGLTVPKLKSFKVKETSSRSGAFEWSMYAVRKPDGTFRSLPHWDNCKYGFSLRCVEGSVVNPLPSWRMRYVDTVAGMEVVVFRRRIEVTAVVSSSWEVHPNVSDIYVDEHAIFGEVLRHVPRC